MSLQNGQKNTQTGRLERRTLLNKRYMIIRTIGQGGMGAVYQARDLRRQTTCAIKEMSLSMVPAEERVQAVQNFKAEAKMLAGLNHPGLPTFSGFFTEGPRHFLVMEYVDGLTLEDYLERNNGPFPERRVLGWARQLCDVLSYLHSQQPPIVFRDMKPGNIMLLHDGHVKLIDFGIARFFRTASSQDTQLLGTPGFAPPEQYGKAQTDERSDIYSLAITLFQLMTNTLSEKGFGLQNVHESYPQISLPVARALEKAAALSAEDRFQSVEAFRRALLGEGTFMFENGEQATTVEELADLCARFPEEASDYLFAGEIESWLQEVDAPDLARTAKRLRAAQTDPQEAVEQFLQAIMGPKAHIRGYSAKHPLRSSSTGKAATVPPTASSSRASHSWIAPQIAPELVVQPLELDFGEVYPGISAPLLLSISGDRGSYVTGTITAKEPWILIDQTAFDGMSTRISVQLNTSRLRGSTHYTGSILVILDDDEEEQDIAVKVEVDVLGRAATTFSSTLSGQSRKGQFQGAVLDDEEDDLLPAGTAGGQVMAPRKALPDDLSTHSIQYNEYRAKYGQPGGGSNATSGAWDPLRATPLQRLWLQRGLTIFAAFMLASLLYTLLSALPSVARHSILPPNPGFILVLVSMIPAATIGALIVNWNSTWAFRNSINYFCTGLSTTLVALGLSEFIWENFIHLTLPSLQLMVMLLVVAVSATFGTHSQISTRMIEGIMRAMDYARWLVIIAAVVLGGLLGFALTSGLALGWFTLLGIVAGSAYILALVGWADHL